MSDRPLRIQPNGTVDWAIDEGRTPRAQWPKVEFRRIGKSKSGRLLDGAEYNGFPQARTA